MTDCCAALLEQVRALEIRLGLAGGQITALEAQLDTANHFLTLEQEHSQRIAGELHALRDQRKREARPVEPVHGSFFDVAGGAR